MQTIPIVAALDQKQALCLWLVISCSALMFWMSRILQNERAARKSDACKMLEDHRAVSKMNAEPGQQTARAVAGLGFYSHDYRRQKPVAGEGQPATPARCAAAAERRLAAALR